MAAVRQRYGRELLRMGWLDWRDELVVGLATSGKDADAAAVWASYGDGHGEGGRCVSEQRSAGIRQMMVPSIGFSSPVLLPWTLELGRCAARASKRLQLIHSSNYHTKLLLPSCQGGSNLCGQLEVT